jgi:spore coat protein U-like protein
MMLKSDHEARGFAGCLVTIALVWCGPALAASCNLSIGSLNFGAFVGTQISTSGSASFTCTNVIPALLPERVDFEIRLSTGAGSYSQRQMNRTATPADTLPYNLYLNFLPAVLNTNVWGDGSGTTVRWTGRMNLSPGQPSRTDTATLVGAIPAGPVPSAGSYQDIVVVTVLIL